VTLVESELPDMDDDEILVGMHSCGICGSDLEKVYGNYGMKSVRVGHEPAGRVIKIGKNTKISRSETGYLFIIMLVAIHVDIVFKVIIQCVYNYQNSNIDPCGLSEQFIVPKWNIERGGVLKLPDSISYDEAALIEPFACCIRGLNKISIKHGDNVAILGAGPTGVMHMLLSKMWGANNIVVYDINDFRLKFVEKIWHNYCKFESGEFGLCN
jgi:L-iditol 2-dehydrogenase